MAEPKHIKEVIARFSYAYDPPAAGRIPSPFRKNPESEMEFIINVPRDKTPEDLKHEEIIALLQTIIDSQSQILTRLRKLENRNGRTL